MQIAIDVPDDFYERVNKDGCMSYTDAEVVVNAFYCGVVLPKGHGRLIDVDKMIDDFKESKAISLAERFKIANIVEHQQTIIEADKEAADEQ